MVYNIGSEAVPWPGFMVAISAGLIICSVLLLVLCACCFKTKVPQYRAKLTKNVVAKEDIRRDTPEKNKSGQRDNRMHSLIFDGAPIGSGRWDDLFVTGGNDPNAFRHDNPERHQNPPDVIMHPALLRVLNKESRNITQKEAIIVPTSSVTSPSRPSHPSSNLQELIQQSQEEETPLSQFPIRREASQEFNRDGSILYYKPRREASSKDADDKHKALSPSMTSPDQSRADDVITSRIEHFKRQRNAVRSIAGNSPKLPHFNRTSGEWDNVPKPGLNIETPPPIPSRNYSLCESDVVTDCSEIMPRPIKDKYDSQNLIDPERSKLSPNRRDAARRTSEISRPSSRSSDASSRILPPSHDLGRVQQGSRNFKNPSPISDTVFIPNENPAYSHGSATPPGHTPRKEHRSHGLKKSDEYNSGVMSDGSFEVVNEIQRPNHRHKRVDDLISDHQCHNQRHFRPGVYYRPKPYYSHLKASEKRYSDASDYSDAMFERNSSFANKAASGEDPYFFRSRWSSAFDAPSKVKRTSGLLSNEPRPQSRERGSRKKKYSRQCSSNESSPDRQHRDSRRSQRSVKSRHSHRQDAPLPEVPFLFKSKGRDLSPSQRNRESCRGGRPPPPLPPLEIVVEQHKDDVLVSPGHQPNYPVDVAKIRRGLQQSHPESKSKQRHDQSKVCDDTVIDPNSNICDSTMSLSVPNAKMRRASSEYGSLIDILYSYRQNVRKSRVKERPTESPESRLKYEREKLKTKLKQELEPREMQTKNVEMVIETLLFLCETESSRDQKKRSWQRDVHSDTNATKSRSNSYETVTPTDDKDEIHFADDDVTSHDDYARVRSHSESRSLFFKGRERNLKEKIEYPGIKIVRAKPEWSGSRDFTVSDSAPPDSADVEFAFPSVEELNRILSPEVTPPPIPPRRGRKPPDDSPPPVAPRNAKIRKSLPPTPDEKIPNGNIRNIESEAKSSRGKYDDVIKVKNEVNEPDYAKIRKKSSRKRRKSLPSRHLTESELLWLKQSGGDADKLSKRMHSSNFTHRNIQGPSRARNRSGAFLHTNNLPSPPEPPIEHDVIMETIICLDDIPVDETTDAEDIIKAVERKMSQSQIVSPHHNADQSPVSKNQNPKSHTDSEMGTWSSVTSSEIPVPTGRTRLHRFNGVSPTHNQSPSQSPVFMRKTFRTPPPSGEMRPRDPVATSMSPVRDVFQTPPATPQINRSNPLASSRRFTSAGDVSIPSPATPSPKIKVRNSQQLFSPKRQRSARPVSPLPTPSKNLSPGGFMPNFSRRSSKFLPKMPIVSKRFVQSTSQNDIVVPIASDRRRVSRTGEIIYLPDDNDYAQPFDAITMESPNRIATSQYRGDLSPRSPVFNLENGSFHPIVEDDDYAVPVNQTPNLLLQQRALARSMENLMSDYESSI